MPIFAQQNNFNIKDYGAIGDGKTVCTKALQKTVDACNIAGGGTILIPQGIFIIGTVHLKSNINLYLQSGAILKGSSSLDDYETFFAGPPYSKIHKGMFFTEDAENVTISGGGQIDGNGDNFLDLNKAKKLSENDTKFTRQKNNFRYVANGIGDGPIVPKERPYQMFVFSSCKRITVKDILVTNSPFWCMHFADCDAVHVSGIRLWNNLLAPNADGIDVTSCTNVIIDGCDIRSGDDAIAIVGYDHHFEIPGFKHLRHPSENIIISNCNLQSYSSGIRIGFLDQNSVRNIHVSNINITNSTRGIGVFLRDEGSLENITFSNINIETHLRTGDWWGNGEPIHISAVRGKDSVKLGQIKHVLFQNIICKGENGMLVYGSEESVIEDVSFDHIRFELADSKLNDVAGGNIDLRGSSLKRTLFERDIPGVLIQYVDGLRLNDFQLKWTGTKSLFFTNGLELNHFNDVEIKDFKGSGSPINPKAHRVFAKEGKNFSIDNNNGVLLQNVH
ncbi:MAG: glycosyl hydrolase family 28 protein [Bacteroidota bacterium]|nr:glycosyl hydrolase family 28 protein [Bacteroidota bacterium]